MGSVCHVPVFVFNTGYCIVYCIPVVHNLCLDICCQHSFDLIQLLWMRSEQIKQHSNIYTHLFAMPNAMNTDHHSPIQQLMRYEINILVGACWRELLQESDHCALCAVNSDENMAACLQKLQKNQMKPQAYPTVRTISSCASAAWIITPYCARYDLAFGPGGCLLASRMCMIIELAIVKGPRW